MLSSYHKFVVCQYYQPSVESHGVFDNHHTAAGGDIYSQYNATQPHNFYNYDQNLSLQTTTNTAAAGNL